VRAPSANHLLLVSFLILVGSAAVRTVVEGDLGFHLAAGRLIAESGAIPRADVLSFTAHGMRWINFEWLYDVIAFGLWRGGGPAAVILAHAAIQLWLFGMLGRAAWRNTSRPGMTAGLLLLAFLVCEVRFSARPQVLEGLFVFLFLQRVLAHRRDAAVTLWPLLGLQVVWVNLHGSHALALLIGALLVIDQAMNRKPWRPSAGWLAGLVAACFVNPFGWRQPRLLVGHWLSAYRSVTNPEWLPLRLSPEVLVDPALWAFAALAVIALAAAWRYADRATFFEWALLVFFAAVPFALHARLLSVSAIGLAVLVIHIRPPAAPRAERWASVAGPVVFLALAGWMFSNGYAIMLDRSGRSGLGVSRQAPGWGAGAYLAQWEGVDRVFNTYGAGGWLSWWLNPRGGRVFIDGRDVGNVYHGYHLVEYRRLLDDPAVFDAAAERDGWPAAVLEHGNLYYQRLLVHLAGHPDWMTGYIDESTVVFVRRSFRSSARPPALSQEFITGTASSPKRGSAREPGPESGWCLALSRMNLADDAARGFEQCLAANDRDIHALTFLGTWHLTHQRLDEAVRLLTRAVRRQRRNGAAHQNLAIALFHTGNLDNAIRHGRAATRWRPRDPQAWMNLAQFYAAAGRLGDAQRCKQQADRWSGRS
jgi:tetratricopeptide (TPR) repeat protein